MSKSPAEQFAESKLRGKYSNLRKFSEGYAFPLDEFQKIGCRHLEDGKSVLVAAPTGAGKTIVGEFATYLATNQGVRCYYTTPIKALSNQKYQEFVGKYGESRVGLLTGDSSVNSNAEILVMTTEVLRNMIYAKSTDIENLGYVVLDEVHYLADRFRGAVWEEILIHLPERIQVVALSATVSNAEEFGEWLGKVRGDTEVVLSEIRPVPLYQHILIGNRLLDLFVDEGRVNPEIIRLEKKSRVLIGQRGNWHDRKSQIKQLSRPEVIEILDDRNYLPAIYFIFSRAGCDAAVEQALRANINLTNREERLLIREIIDRKTAELPSEDFGILGFDAWCEAAERGIAAHHAGLLPMFKETIEELFQRGLLKIVFATETLALGINMPARTVFLEKLIKWNGESHAPVSPGEYTQLTGRAGRRGIDIEGNAVVMWSDQIDSSMAASLASTRTYPLRSSFNPTYNMSANLISRFGKIRARSSLSASFAQFQADRGVSGLLRQITKNRDAIGTLLNSEVCHLGDFSIYAKMREEISSLERSYRSREKRNRIEIDKRIGELRRELKSHPCHLCPERENHARKFEKAFRLERETAGLSERVSTRTNVIPRTFDRVVHVLQEMHYLVDEKLSEKGKTLIRIYAESDLLLAEIIHSEIFPNLSAPDLVAVLSALVYEGRGEKSKIPRIPKSVELPMKEVTSTWRRIVNLEDEHGLASQREPNFDLAWSAYRWANGYQLNSILRETEIPVGDFVRNMRQIIDLLGQLRGANISLKDLVEDAIARIDRGVIAYSAVVS
ncbi:MAG: DEAD/DEAH box helicase [Actinomycetota bacterium]